MKIASMGVVKKILERKEAELVLVLRKRDGIAIKKSADQMDEIQYASERDLAIRKEIIDGWILSGDLISKDLIDKAIEALELLKKK
jgi:hypothetical protein